MILDSQLRGQKAGEGEGDRGREREREKEGGKVKEKRGGREDWESG